MSVRRLNINDITISSISPVLRRSNTTAIDENTCFSAKMSIDPPNRKSNKIEVTKCRKDSDRTPVPIDETIIENHECQVESLNEVDSDSIKKEPSLNGSEETIINEKSICIHNDETEVSHDISKIIEGPKDFIEEEQNDGNSTVSSLEDDGIQNIFTNAHAAQFESDQSDADSFWSVNPFDNAPNYRPRHQSFDNTITEIANERKIEVIKNKRKGSKKLNALEKITEIPDTHEVETHEQIVDAVTVYNHCKKVLNNKHNTRSTKPAQKTTNRQTKLKSLEAKNESEILEPEIPKQQTRKTLSRSQNSSKEKNSQKLSPKITRLKTSMVKMAQDDSSKNNDSLDESNIVPKARVRKSVKKTQVKTKKAPKRKLSDEDPGDSPVRKCSSGTSSNSRDEGFQEDENQMLDEDFDVRYFPQNDRYTFRKRRYMRPYWLPNADPNLRYEFVSLTAQDLRAEKKINKIKKEAHININKFTNDPILQPTPVEKLKIVREIAKEKNRLSKITKNQSKKEFKKLSNGNHESFDNDPSKLIAEAFKMESRDDCTNFIENYENFGELIGKFVISDFNINYFRLLSN